MEVEGRPFAGRSDEGLKLNGLLTFENGAEVLSGLKLSVKTLFGTAGSTSTRTSNGYSVLPEIVNFKDFE